VGVDPDSKKLKIAQKIKDKSILFHNKLMTDTKFDCITLIDVLYLLNKKERSRLFNRMRNLLNANGRIIINTNFYDDSAKFKLTAFLEMFFVRYLQTTHSASKNVFYTQFSTFQEEIERAGFSIEFATEKSHTLFYPHHIVVLRLKAN
jgi:cyclopropane fatty-acyl-phospholipid synthase-like methyltransferase